MQPLSLYELNNLVRGTLEATLCDTFWITAELSEVRQAANGHCYVEFVEKNPHSNALVAKARGNIWRSTYSLISRNFERETGQRLAPGMKVLVEVQVSFHELYGYSQNVTDIDPTYTIGDLAQRRKEILAQLDEDGVLTLNKELSLPRPLSRIAVISSSTAAGYGDFRNQLENSAFVFTTQLFPATMQGNLVEESVIAALDAIAAEQEQWDAVVIIRGGGAVSDLNGFDTYLLAANVAQFPLPVLTGIGHERDDTVIDMVAHTRLKTPTAVAAFLIERQRDEAEHIADLEERLFSSIERRMEWEHTRFEQKARRFQNAATQYVGKEREYLLRLASRMEVKAREYLQQQQFTLTQMPQRLQKGIEQQMTHEKMRLDFIEKSLTMAGPERILKMGFSITLHNGKAVTQARQLKSGDRIVTQLAKGEIESIVE